MIVVEILAGLLVSTIIIIGMLKIGAPIADAFGHRLKMQFQEMAPEQERLLRIRVEELERQVRELQTQMISAQEQIAFDRKIDRQIGR